MEVVAEGGPLSIEGDCAVVGDMTPFYGCLRRAGITEEITLVGRWHIFHKPRDCEIWVEWKKERKR